MAIGRTVVTQETHRDDGSATVRTDSRRTPVRGPDTSVGTRGRQVSKDGIVNGRLKIIGVMLAVIGLAFIAGGGYAFYKTNQGAQVAPGIQRRAERHAQLQRSRTAGRPRRDRRRRRDHGAAGQRLGLRGQHSRTSTRTIRWSTPPASTCTRWPRSPITPCTARRRSSSTRTSRLRRHRLRRRHVRVRERRPLLDRLRPGEPDRGCRPRADLDRHGTRADRRARRRQRHGLGPPDRPGLAALLAGFGGTILLRASAWCGRRAPRRAGQGSGPAAGDHDRLEPRTGFPTRYPDPNGVGPRPTPFSVRGNGLEIRTYPSPRLGNRPRNRLGPHRDAGPRRGARPHAGIRRAPPSDLTPHCRP